MPKAEKHRGWARLGIGPLHLPLPLGGVSDTFTGRARAVLGHAQTVAHQRRSAAIGDEHILLGLVYEGKGIGAAALHNLGVDAKPVEAALAPSGDVQTVPQESEGALSLTPLGRRVIELAAEEARRLDHLYVGTEHLLLGMLALGDGSACSVLTDLGVTLGAARAEVVRLLAERPARDARKRYNLALPESLYREVEALAEREQTTVLEVIRRSIKLGLLISNAQEQTDTTVVIRQGEREREIILL